MLAAPFSAFAGESAATLYALNCRGCHQAPEAAIKRAPPLSGQFADTDIGRVFFINVPTRPLRRAEDARLLQEIAAWRRSCAATLQDAPLVHYSEGWHAK